MAAPKALRRLPAEWEPQRAVMLTWPHEATDWAPFLTEVEAVYRRLAALISTHQELLIVCRDAAHRHQVAAQLEMGESGPHRIRFAIAPSNDTWARDHGPITVIDGSAGPRLIDFRFNGWGGKHAADLDDQITATLHADGAFGETPLERSGLVLEGGAIDTDGRGTLLAVRRTILDPARNPGWTADALEDELRHRLGVERILWLEHGQLTGDDTDGHIDTLARFCTPGIICHAHSDDPADADHASLARLADELRALRRPDGSPYRLVPLPQPAPIHDADGHRLPAGYANFLIINRSVLLPVYGDPADRIAINRLSQIFPRHRIEPVDCRPLIRQGGSLHCVTMQLAAADTEPPAPRRTGPEPPETLEPSRIS